MSEQKQFFWVVLIESELDQSEELGPVLEKLCPWGWEETAQGSGTRITIYCRKRVEAERIRKTLSQVHPDLRLELHKVPVQDWSQAWRTFFHPLQLAGKFQILPAWEQNVQDHPGLIPVIIEPGMAFGTGHHASTQLCLQALAILWDTEQISHKTHFLDLGTGSGILAMSAAKMGCKGLGLDIDPAAISNAVLNKGLNDLGSDVLFCTGSLECLKPEQTFHLILANILARPLIQLRSCIDSRLRPCGILVLSGILREQEEEVGQAYTEQNYHVRSCLHQEEWSGLILVKD